MTAKTIKPYTVEAFGYNYRFWQDFGRVAKAVTGFERSMLAHDLTYYGLNIPPEYCEPYKP